MQLPASFSASRANGKYWASEMCLVSSSSRMFCVRKAASIRLMSLASRSPASSPLLEAVPVPELNEGGRGVRALMLETLFRTLGHVIRQLVRLEVDR